MRQQSCTTPLRRTCGACRASPPWASSRLTTPAAATPPASHQVLLCTTTCQLLVPVGEGMRRGVNSNALEHTHVSDYFRTLQCL